MEHADHVALLREGVGQTPASTWIDLGAGSGAFTLALADLLPASAAIIAVDRDRGALAELDRAYAARRQPGPRLETRVADFTRDLGLTAVDGVVMANSLHFFRDKRPVLARVRSILGPDGRLIVVEYDAVRGNPWVPYPFTFDTWRRIASDAGFAEPRLLARRASRFLNGFWSAVTVPVTAP